VLGITYHTLRSYLNYQPDAADEASAADWARDDPATPSPNEEERVGQTST
jgi:hypothetical protein